MSLRSKAAAWRVHAKEKIRGKLGTGSRCCRMSFPPPVDALSEGIPWLMNRSNSQLAMTFFHYNLEEDATVIRPPPSL